MLRITLKYDSNIQRRRTKIKPKRAAQSDATVLSNLLLHDIVLLKCSYKLFTCVQVCIQIEIHRSAHTFIFLPPNITAFICSTAKDAASGISYSMKAKPLCLFATGSKARWKLLIGPNGRNAWRTVSSFYFKIYAAYVNPGATTKYIHFL